MTLGGRCHALEPLRIGHRAQDGLGQRRRLGTVDQEAVPAAIDEFRQTVAVEPHDGRPRRHRLEIDLAPGVVQHRLNQQRGVAKELLQGLPGKVRVEGDSGPVADEGAAAFVADNGERQVRPATPRQLERLEQQHAALGLEQMLGDEEKRRLGHSSSARRTARWRPCRSRRR